MSKNVDDSFQTFQWGNDDCHANVLHVDMDSFFASVELREDPALKGQPVIIGGLGNRGVVTSATYEARAYGVRAGMPIARAHALCPNATILSGRLDLYRKYSDKIMEVFTSITPIVEKASIDEAFLDVSGSRLRLGGSHHIALMIQQRIDEEIGLPSSIGISATKSIAKIASAYAKPHGILLIPQGKMVDFLHTLPLTALWGVGRKTREKLDVQGITTVKGLAHYDLGRLTRLLGAASAHHLHNQAWGIDPRRVSCEREEKSMGTERTFETNVMSRSEIERYIVQASHECARRLRAKSYVTWSVAIKIRDKEFHTKTRSCTLSEPTDVGQVITRHALDLFSHEEIPVGGVRLFGVRTERLQSREDGVPIGFDNDERLLAIERTMDNVYGKFGTKSLGPASLLMPVEE